MGRIDVARKATRIPHVAPYSLVHRLTFTAAGTQALPVPASRYAIVGIKVWVAALSGTTPALTIKPDLWDLSTGAKATKTLATPAYALPTTAAGDVLFFHVKADRGYKANLVAASGSKTLDANLQLLPYAGTRLVYSNTASDAKVESTNRPMAPAITVAVASGSLTSAELQVELIVEPLSGDLTAL